MIAQSAIPAPLVDADRLNRAIASRLVLLADETEALGAELSVDPAVVNEHMTALQSIDAIAQSLGQIASILRSSEPAAAIENVNLEDLKNQLMKALDASPSGPVTKEF